MVNCFYYFVLEQKKTFMFNKQNNWNFLLRLQKFSIKILFSYQNNFMSSNFRNDYYQLLLFKYIKKIISSMLLPICATSVRINFSFFVQQTLYSEVCEICIAFSNEFLIAILIDPNY